MVARKEAGLQFSDPVKAYGLRLRLITRQMALEHKLLKLPIVKAAEFRRRTTEGPDEPEPRGNVVNHETKPGPGLLGKLEAILGLTFHLRERISCCQKICVQVETAVRCEN